MRLVMLGSGSSAGVPRVGNDWGLCDPANPRNRRRRVSVLVEAGPTRILVDTSPDLREQLLDAGIDHVSAVLFTHDHADHVHGIDDLRPLFHRSGEPIACYMNRSTRTALRTRFRYVFAGASGYPPTARAELLEGAVDLGGIMVRPFRQEHGPVESLGFRFEHGGKAIAYSTDVSGLPKESWPFLEGLDLWVVDALRRAPHPTHSHLARTLDWIARAGPRKAWLTHMDQSMDHDTLLAELPPPVTPGYDGRVWEGGCA